MSVVTWLILASMVVQLAAAAAALTLIRRTRHHTAWVLLTSALVAMAVWRGISLVGGLGGYPDRATAVATESVALLISVLVLLAVLHIRRLLRLMWESEHGVDRLVADVTERRRDGEAAHREARLFAHGPVVVMRWTADRRIVFVSENVRQWGFEPDDLIGRATVYDLVPQDDRARTIEEASAAAAAGRESWTQEYRLLCPDGRERCVVDVTVASRDANGRVVHTDGYLLDVTEHRRAEASLERSDAILRAVSFAAERLLLLPDWRSGVAAVLGRLGEAAGVSRAYVFENHHDSEGRLLSRQRWEWSAPGVESQLDSPELEGLDYVAGGFAAWLEPLGSGRTVVSTPAQMPEPARALLTGQDVRSLVVTPILVGDEWWGFMGFDQCDHERQWSGVELEALRVAAQTQGAAILRQRVEEQLRQAHKIEAVGQLAGGIAHDFNNLLTALMGSAELLRRSLPEGDESADHLAAIQRTAQRAAELTRRLLAFSRRHHTEPSDLDLNQLLSDFLETLRRVMPENIALDFVPGHELGVVRADRGQVEQVLMNLCANARDAMPGDGTLTLETENVFINGRYIASHPWARAGRYVLLSVSDSGEGMAPEVLDRVFEPFFTTKEQGKGTGLGLASVYGIVKQADGMVNGYSELGKGSTFKVYLPLVERPAAQVGAKIDGPVRGGNEAVLVVEDETEVRRVVTEFLSGLGYRVVDAPDGRAALEILRRQPVDLVITDMVMPHMGGLELYRAAADVVPGTAFLFSSGYSEAALGAAGIQAGMHFLAKPYGLDQLARTVRTILEGAGS